MSEITYKNKKDSIISKLDELLHENTPKLIIFNKESGEFCGIIATGNDENVDSTYYKHRKIKFNGNTQMWDGGNFEEGKVINIDEAVSVITEAEVNAQTNATIVDEYPWFKQSNIIINVLNSLIKKANIKGEDVDEFNAMVNYIALRRDLNERYKNAYSQDNSFKYVTTKEDEDVQNKRLAGGLHEQVGSAQKAINLNNPS
jgi:hypothetical protein